MFYFKACPRCKGDLCEGGDIHGEYVSCMQCGHYLTREEESGIRFSASRLFSLAEAFEEVRELAA